MALINAKTELIKAHGPGAGKTLVLLVDEQGEEKIDRTTTYTYTCTTSTYIDSILRVSQNAAVEGQANRALYCAHRLGLGT